MALPLASLVAVLALAAWQFLPPFFGVPKYIIPQLSDLWTEGLRMWQDDNLLLHFFSTASMAILGFILGSLLGAVFGYALGLLPAWEKVLSPYILALQIAPKVAFAPLFIFMVKCYNFMPKLVTTVLVVFFPILVNVLQAMRVLDRSHQPRPRLQHEQGQDFLKSWCPTRCPPWPDCVSGQRSR